MKVLFSLSIIFSVLLSSRFEMDVHHLRPQKFETRRSPPEFRLFLSRASLRGTGLRPVGESAPRAPSVSCRAAPFQPKTILLQVLFAFSPRASLDSCRFFPSQRAGPRRNGGQGTKNGLEETSSPFLVAKDVPHPRLWILPQSFFSPPPPPPPM